MKIIVDKERSNIWRCSLRF